MVAINLPIAAELQVRNATDRVASAVKTTRFRDGSTMIAKANAAAVQNPLSTTAFRRFQPRSTRGAQRNERKKGHNAIAVIVAIW